ncbi:MAG TPA: NYN domain-containing protein [Gemmataceae bacterium]|nr:NYN domain-containing protein [Gemmataceae bacterium]
MTYLIDGYNLLHALGLLRSRVGPHGLEKARLRLLGYLSGAYGPAATAVTVVFDAHDAPPGIEQQHDYQGVHVRFAVDVPEADDLIEQLIRHDAAPRQLTVVSDDHRVQKAARRRHCQVVGCLDYMEELDRSRRSRRQARQETEKQQGMSPEEAQHWLKEFADLENEPDLKALEPFDFSEEGFE